MHGDYGVGRPLTHSPETPFVCCDPRSGHVKVETEAPAALLTFTRLTNREALGVRSDGTGQVHVLALAPFRAYVRYVPGCCRLVRETRAGSLALYVSCLTNRAKSQVRFPLFASFILHEKHQERDERQSNARPEVDGQVGRHGP